MYCAYLFVLADFTRQSSACFPFCPSLIPPSPLISPLSLPAGTSRKQAAYGVKKDTHGSPRIRSSPDHQAELAGQPSPKRLEKKRTRRPLTEASAAITIIASPATCLSL
ncbi:hypothetical protein VTN77DRAFT_669 [Rasamsonia byssochlamydoides]|uniref:uncharacterized protein n=1 Tax=Rasamsonia byssochlamydoides TaxID=89139 RepID=UPI00374328FA